MHTFEFFTYVILNTNKTTFLQKIIILLIFLTCFFSFLNYSYNNYNNIHYLQNIIKIIPFLVENFNAFIFHF